MNPSRDQVGLVLTTNKRGNPMPYQEDFPGDPPSTYGRNPGKTAAARFAHHFRAHLLTGKHGGLTGRGGIVTPSLLTLRGIALVSTTPQYLPNKISQCPALTEQGGMSRLWSPPVDGKSGEHIRDHERQPTGRDDLDGSGREAPGR